MILISLLEVCELNFSFICGVPGVLRELSQIFNSSTSLTFPVFTDHSDVGFYYYWLLVSLTESRLPFFPDFGLQILQLIDFAGPWMEACMDQAFIQTPTRGVLGLLK